MNQSTPRNTANNVPAFRLYSIERKPADKAEAAKRGKVLAENATVAIWTEVGVAFPTKSGSGAMTIIIGAKGDPKQKRFLLCATSALDDNRDPESRIPVGELFELTDADIDFKRRAGVCFINSDGSYNLVLGDRGDLEQPRYNMRRPDPKPAVRKAPTQPARNSTVRREQAAAAA